ncbi:hypothetical protein BH23ACT12_BH23ACT12_20050 [soil metagenome]
MKLASRTRPGSIERLWKGRWSGLQIAIAGGTVTLMILGSVFAAIALTPASGSSPGPAAGRQLNAIARTVASSLEDVPDASEESGNAETGKVTTGAQAGFTIVCPSSLKPDGDYDGITTCQVKSSPGFSAPVELSCSGSAGTTECKTIPASVTPAADGSASFQVGVNTNQRSKKYTIEVVGRSGDLRAGSKLSLGLGHLDPANAPPDYNLNCAHLGYNDPLVVAAGASAQIECNLVSWGGYTGPVTLLCTPSGSLSCRFEGSPVTLVPNGTTVVKLSVAVPADAQPGRSQLEVKGRAPGAPSARDCCGYSVQVEVPMHTNWFPPPPPPVAGMLMVCPFSGMTFGPGEAFTQRCFMIGTGGFAGQVALSLQGDTAGISVVPSVAISGTPPSAIGFPVEIRFDPSLIAPGAHSMTLLGSSGAITQSSVISYTATG